jgi:hypothetical protein
MVDVEAVVVRVAFEAGVVAAITPEAIFVPASAETRMFPQIASDPETVTPDAGTTLSRPSTVLPGSTAAERLA